jgi:hypothetical protein
MMFMRNISPAFRFRALPERGRRSGGNRNATLLLLLHPVHGRGTIMHFADFVRFAGVVQNAFSRRRFTGINVCHDAEVTVTVYGYSRAILILYSVSVYITTSGSERMPCWLLPFVGVIAFFNRRTAIVRGIEQFHRQDAPSWCFRCGRLRG